MVLNIPGNTGQETPHRTQTKINVYRVGSMNVSVPTLLTGIWVHKKMFPDWQTMNAANPSTYHNARENATAKGTTTVYFTQQGQWNQD